MYCREGSDDPFVILDDPAANKDDDAPRVLGRLLLCSSLGLFGLTSGV